MLGAKGKTVGNQRISEIRTLPPRQAEEWWTDQWLRPRELPQGNRPHQPCPLPRRRVGQGLA